MSIEEFEIEFDIKPNEFEIEFNDIQEIYLEENLSEELTEQDNQLTIQETTIEDIILALENKSSGGGIFPEGTLDITENGEYDVYEKATVNVDVPVGVFPEGNIDITNTEEYDVTNYATAKIKDDNLKPENIAEDVEILGLKGTFRGGIDTSDATATSDDLLLGKTAYANEEKIEGTIETYDYSNSEAVNVTNPFRDFMGGEKTTITKEDTEGVTNFPAYILYTNDTVTSVELADTVLKTGQRAFSQASKLTSVKLPQNLQELGAYAFTQTTGITEIELPDTLKTIGGNAFQGIPIKSIIIPDSVTSSIASCCLNCTNLEYAKLGNGITTVGANAFSGCSNLKTVILGSSTSFISGSMFLNCTSLETITLPRTVKTISTQSFDGCTALKEIICLAENPPTLSANSFNKVPDDCIFRVPSTSVDKYKSATNWSTRADYIVAYEGGN